MVAKKSGIRVERFSLGFPPRLIGKKIGDTEYCISWIPLGGYVKMAGEEPDEKELKGEPWEFMSKPVRTRALVVFAGPAMNFILAILIFWGIIFLAGRQEIHEDTNQIGLVAPGGPADKAGIKSGDQIISINGIEVSTFKDMAEIIYQQVEKPVEVTWKRDEEEYTAMIVLPIPPSKLAFSAHFWRALTPPSLSWWRRLSSSLNSLLVPHLLNLLVVPSSLLKWRGRPQKPGLSASSPSRHFCQSIYV